MDNGLVSMSIRSGILAGNENLERWTGGDWVCDRGSVEYVLVAGVADRLHADLPPGWLIWPEAEAADDFAYVGTNYREYVQGCQPRSVFGGVRYDLGLLRSHETISGLVEIKRYWTKDDLTKLAEALFYLGISPQRIRDGGKAGVLLESVFVGSFIWHKPGGSPPLDIQRQKIDTEVRAWWNEAATRAGVPFREAFRAKYDGICPQPEVLFLPETGGGSNKLPESGAVCVCLSLSEEP
jgi:hypothetical protein